MIIPMAADWNELRVLGEQYSREADNLYALIRACRERRRAALARGNGPEAQRQERLIELHTQQRADLLQLVAWLRHYLEAGA